MAEQPLAKQMDFAPAYFSFNAEGGRCEECKGDGTVKVEMQFMADLVLECESCHGKRFKRDVLDVMYHGKNIFDMLEMTVNQAIEFFSDTRQKTQNRAAIATLARCRIGLHQTRAVEFDAFGRRKPTCEAGVLPQSERAQPTLFIFRRTDDGPPLPRHQPLATCLLRPHQSRSQHCHY